MAAENIAEDVSEDITKISGSGSAAEWTLPLAAADFLQAHHVTSRMFNTYENGGYLVWRLWPAERDYIDPRGLSEEAFVDYNRILYYADSTGGKSADELLAKYGIQVLVLDAFDRYDGRVHTLAAALSDPDAQPLSAERLAKMRRVPRVKALRQRLGVTQAQFAVDFHLPITTLRGWEQGRSTPDAPARALLLAIERVPK